jgi:hypothetical protein
MDSLQWMTPEARLTVALIIVGAVVGAVVTVIRDINRWLDQREYRTRSQAHPQEWDR